MISVILKDGSEVVLSSDNPVARISPYGVYDKNVFIYRARTKSWELGLLTSLHPGDAFRNINQSSRDETVYFVTETPRVVHHPNLWLGRQKDPDILIKGLIVGKVSSILKESPPAVLTTPAQHRQLPNPKFNNLLIEDATPKESTKS